MCRNAQKSACLIFRAFWCTHAVDPRKTVSLWWRSCRGMYDIFNKRGALSSLVVKDTLIVGKMWLWKLTLRENPLKRYIIWVWNAWLATRLLHETYVYKYLLEERAYSSGTQYGCDIVYSVRSFPQVRRRSIAGVNFRKKLTDFSCICFTNTSSSPPFPNPPPIGNEELVTLELLQTRAWLMWGDYLTEYYCRLRETSLQLRLKPSGHLYVYYVCFYMPTTLSQEKEYTHENKLRNVLNRLLPHGCGLFYLFSGELQIRK